MRNSFDDKSVARIGQTVRKVLGAPIDLTSGVVRRAGSVESVALVKFTTTEEVDPYPTVPTGFNSATWYPGKILSATVRDGSGDGIDWNDDEEGLQEVEVFQTKIGIHGSLYIPENTIALAWQFAGQWFTDWHRAILLGKLNGNINPTTADCSISLYEGLYTHLLEETGEIVPAKALGLIRTGDGVGDGTNVIGSWCEHLGCYLITAAMCDPLEDDE